MGYLIARVVLWASRLVISLARCDLIFFEWRRGNLEKLQLLVEQQISVQELI